MSRHAIVPAYLLACLLLGGASAAGFIANLTLQLIALPLIVWSLWHLIESGVSPQVRTALALGAALVAIALLQLIPLPPAIWTLLPGRDAIAKGYGLIGVPLPWLPLTLAPDRALASLLWLLPAFATFLGIIMIGAFRARSIAGVIVLVTLASIVLGALQVVDGSESAYFYEITNFGLAVGFFANSNHTATLLLVCIPFLAALQTNLLSRGAKSRSASAIRLLTVAMYILIFVGLLLNSSLAGIGLSVPIALGTWLVFGKQRPVLRKPLAIVTIVATVATIVAIAVGPFGNNLFGQQNANVEASRQTSFSLTWEAAREFFPIGSGIGSFQSVYHMHEKLPSVTSTFMNHAHSDWLELLLETGLPGMVLTVVFLAWVAVRARAIWQAESPDHFAQAAIIAIVAMMLHSLVDYPLRTAALSAVFSACVALITGARPYVRRQRITSSARHLNL
ncbi:O-antigen polymerase [Sphingomonas sp. Leaf357]|uniref:O-antigen ligase family protein n=1 Tax=Sphingomonas sp. Leaf357 TaxID=1736350 RepID=UPI0006FC0341|nr:O-antigen ligase family protein [Sphingomonas sp. Leaf357]KQS04356.1 O-antigen polymerase [Sphingomonas sp. Leaf357]